jgi:hypothetical protein
MAEKPNAFNDAVLRFLDEVDANNRDDRDDRDDRDNRQVAAS